jgi:hypothetical protein
MSVSVEKVTWGDWQNCYKIANAHIELIVTADVGPRVISLSRIGGENIFAVRTDQLGDTGGDTWNIFGGHRLWHAPEVQPRTYYPDNNPVTVEEVDGEVRFTAPDETSNGVRKQIALTLAPDSPHVTVRHTITNVGVWDIEFAIWSLSVMGTGGTAVLPLPPYGSHRENLLPKSNLTLWAYTNLSDPRWTFTPKYILLRQTEGDDITPQKIGASVPLGWGAYVRNGDLFIKRFDVLAGNYPDMNSSLELFTNDWMLELETLGQMVRLAPGASATHTERWSLHGGIAYPKNADDVDATILPLV